MIATSGRLKYFVQSGLLDFSHLNYLILDEADRMLDEVEWVLTHFTMPQVVIRLLSILALLFLFNKFYLLSRNMALVAC